MAEQKLWIIWNINMKSGITEIACAVAILWVNSRLCFARNFIFELINESFFTD
jgi:hypothetical protein